MGGRATQHRVDSPQQGAPGLVVEGDDDCGETVVIFIQRERTTTTPEVVGRLASLEYLSLQSGCEVIGRDLSETGGLSDLLIKTNTLS